MALVYSSGRRRRRVLVYQTGRPAVGGSATPLHPLRTIVQRVVRQRNIPPRITSIHTPVVHGVFQSARPPIVVARAPQPRRIPAPIVKHTLKTPNQALPNHVQPRPTIVHDIRYFWRGRPVVINTRSGRIASAIPPRPPLVIRPPQPRRAPAPVSIHKLHARQSIQAPPLRLIVRVPLPVPRARPVVVITNPRGAAQIPRPRSGTESRILIVRRAPALPYKFYAVSTWTDRIARMPRQPKPLVASAIRGPSRPLLTITSSYLRSIIVSSGAGSIAPRPIRPLIVRPPAPFRLPAKLITPVLDNRLKSPTRSDPRSLIGVFRRRYGASSVEILSSSYFYRTRVVSPPQPIPPVNPPQPGVPPTPPDLIAACIAWLRLNAPIVAAFGDAAATEKFGSDIEARGTAPPYLVFYEPEEDEGYETADYTGSPSSLADGTFFVEVVGPQTLGKLGTRQLAEQVVASLNDAPLTFLDGVLVYLRRSGRKYPTFRASGPGSNIVLWKRIIEFQYKIERYVN
jgi:hypothetical protein